MAEYKRPSNEAELAENFGQIHPDLDAAAALRASSRCLFCYDAPCISACPTEIDIPLFIKQINSGNVQGAADTIYASNYFGQICGKVCPTEVLCEGACVYNEQDIEPVEIGRLQSYACKQIIEDVTSAPEAAHVHNQRIAIVGAGPAGIACACELRTLGYEVDVYDGRQMPSGLALYGTAPYKITNEEVTNEVEFLRRRYGFNLKLGERIDNPKALEDQYRAIFLGIGLGRTRSAGVPGEDMQGCWGATEFIEQVKHDPLGIMPGRVVLVVGGGNTAMDAASESARLGAEEVHLLYRRDKNSMSAYSFEYELAKDAGVRGMFNVTPVRVLGDNRVTGLECQRTTMGADGWQAVENSNFTISCDTVIWATGQRTREDFLSRIDRLELSSGKIDVKENYQTTNAMYFAGGDAVNGGAEVVYACADGKRAARGIDSWLNNQNQ